MTNPSLFGLIFRGYFPKELPPAFTTLPLARISSGAVSFDPSFCRPTIPSKNIIHSFLARSNSRRHLGIVNPVDYIALATAIVQNWNSLRPFINKSQISLTSPVFHGPPGRAFGYKYTFDSMDDRKAIVRSRSRYVLRADINQFYHSIYTHSIAWALHGKRIAKSQRSNARLLGNVLDKLIRNSQDNQTIGVPIGPDSSFLIAEIILSVCDENLSKAKIRNVTRFVDDYEFGCESLHSAEYCRDKLQEILGEFELVLNPDKTKILELPVPLELPCISTIRTFDLNNLTSNSQRYALIRIFDIVFENVTQNSDSPLLKYLLGKLSRLTIEKSNWTLYENLLLQCAMSDPSTISYIVDEFWKYKKADYSLGLTHIQDVMSTLISLHAPLNHSSEVTWALWTQIVLGLPIAEFAAKQALKMSDPIVAILLLDARSKSLIKSTINVNQYQSLMSNNDLFSDQWLLSYEANVKHWLPSVGSQDHVASDRCFNFLKSNSVSFYDDKWVVKNKPTITQRKISRPGRGGGGEPGSY
jgi:hypothetical protein